MAVTFTGKVTNKDWLTFKPYNAFSDYDKPFLKLANEVNKLFLSEKKWFSNYEMGSENLKDLACILTSYFEDYISEIGIWQAFINHNKQTCGYYLPFYDLTDYDPDYLNWQDTAYLIWHYMSKNHEDVTLAPDYPLTLAFAQDIFDLFENAIETTDATDFYESYFSVPANLNFFDFKTRLAWLTFDAYLLGPDANRAFADDMDELFAASPPQIQREMIAKFMYANREKYLYAHRFSFGALNAPELFAKLATCPEPKIEEIKNLALVHSGKFTYEGAENNYFLFRHLVTKQLYRVRQDSVQQPPTDATDKSIYDFSVVKWDNDWWITGILIVNELSPAKITNYQDQPFTKSWMYAPEQLQKLQESTELMYASFVEYYGSPLAIFDSPAKLEASLEDYFDFHAEKQGLADEGYKKRREAFKNEQQKLRSAAIQDLPDEEKPTGIFFMKGVGTITIANIAEIIRMMEAPSLSEKEQVDLFLDLYINLLPAVSEYLLQNYPTKNVKFPLPGSQVDALQNKEYFWRFYNPQEFAPIYPLLTMVDFK